jgi:three-Cys-motif partner protein
MATGFFEEQKDQSAIKANIIRKYFFAWANVLKKSIINYGSNIAYIDLFAGPGRYKDGSASVPLLILESAVQDEFLRDRLATVFNDKDDNNVQSLQTEVAKIEGINSLKIKPQICHGEVGDEISSKFEEINLVPTFFFVDPWGYKCLSLRLINSVLKNWGCDCVFFSTTIA